MTDADGLARPTDDATAALVAKIAPVIDSLETAATNWDTLTAAQKDAALKVVVRLSARLARIVARQLDATP
jgi:hypothetical protein